MNKIFSSFSARHCPAGRANYQAHFLNQTAVFNSFLGNICLANAFNALYKLQGWLEMLACSFIMSKIY